MRKKFFILFIVSICCLNWLVSQTIEEQLLKPKELKLKIYYYQANVGSRETKLQVLDKITREFDEEKYSQDDVTLMNLLSELSQEGTTRKVYENNRLLNDYPEVRRSALKVLAKIGGDEVRDILITTLLNEKSDVVKAEICLAAQQDNIGDNRKGEFLKTLIHVYRKSNRHSENFVFAIINAVKKIAKPNSPQFAEAVRLLSDINMGNYSRKIRNASMKAMNELGGIK